MSTVKQTSLGLGALALGIACIVGLAFGIPYLSLQVKKTYGTEFESVQTDIYRENKGFVEGTIKDLRELQVDYHGATEPAHKNAIADLAKQRAGELDEDRIPNSLKRWLETL